MNFPNYVCAFRGRRDDYQVPLALAKAGRLEEFITDAYATRFLRSMSPFFPKKVQQMLSFRHSGGIPDAKVSCLWRTTAREHLRHRQGQSRAETYALLDQEFSRAAEKAARKTRSHLFLYSPYAWEAFQARYQHQPRKVLFEYHPHPFVESDILAKDVARFPEVNHSYQEATGDKLPESLRRRISDAWRLADLIVCASSFTRQTVVSAGADEGKCVVIPYGVELSGPIGKVAPSEKFEVLFVGSGVQRKGLHHLLRAWKTANLPAESRLTLVCRNLDPGLEETVARSPRTRLIRGTSAGELANLYQTSTLFAMPSLVEGFGQVYLEALSHGCAVLGTANTCLPDLGSEEDSVFLTKAGDIAGLAARLEELASTQIASAESRWRAQLCASRFTWQRFRTQLQKVL